VGVYQGIKSSRVQICTVTSLVHQLSCDLGFIEKVVYDLCMCVVTRVRNRLTDI